MSKRMIRILSVLSIILALVGAALIVAGIVGGPWTTNTARATSFASLSDFVAGVIIAALALVTHQIAWAGALVNLARLQRWSWFGFVLAFHGLAMLVYLVAGPTTPADTTPGAPYMQVSDQQPQHALQP